LAAGSTAAADARDDVDSADVTFTADPGEANRVVVRAGAGRLPLCRHRSRLEDERELRSRKLRLESARSAA